MKRKVLWGAALVGVAWWASAYDWFAPGYLDWKSTTSVLDQWAVAHKRKLSAWFVVGSAHHTLIVLRDQVDDTRVKVRPFKPVPIPNHTVVVRDLQAIEEELR